MSGSIKIGVTGIGLRETREWLTRRQAGLKSAIQEEMVGATALAHREGTAKAVVDAYVYAAYPETPTYKRRMNLLKSVGAVELQRDPPAAGIVINTDQSPAKLPPSDVSYARFMLKDSAHQSFFHGAARETIPRDFLEVWFGLFGEMLPSEMKRAIDRELRKP